MGTQGTYRETVAHFTRWAFGQRMVHDLVVHPLMALTRYSDWSLKLHDYHSFANMKPGERRTIGIMGHVEDVHAAFAALDIEIENTHADGAICCGTGPIDLPSKKGKGCRACGGRGYNTQVTLGPDNNRHFTRVECRVCQGTGK